MSWMREGTTIPGFEKMFPRILQQVDDAIIESKTPNVIANHYIGANRRFDTIGEAANQLDLAQQPSIETTRAPPPTSQSNQFRLSEKPSLKTNTPEDPRPTARIHNDRSGLKHLFDRGTETHVVRYVDGMFIKHFA